MLLDIKTLDSSISCKLFPLEIQSVLSFNDPVLLQGESEANFVYIV